MADLNQTEISVEHDGVQYIFAIPTLRDEARISTFVQSLIAQDSKDSGVEVRESSLDTMAQLQYRTLALFSLQLKKCSDAWPYKENPQTKQLEINLEAIPSEAGNIYIKYVEKLNEFFRSKSNTGKSNVAASVAGEPNPPG